MPPFVGRKRVRSSSPPGASNAKTLSLFESADKPTSLATVQDNKVFLADLDGFASDNSLSEISSSEFEDVEPQPKAKKLKTEHADDDDEIDWEDAMQGAHSVPEKTSAPGKSQGDLELRLDKGTNTMSLGEPYGKKKGPSKIERQIRVATHCMHVQFLLFHNLIRNGWVCDKEVQASLVCQLPERVKEEIQKWKVASGLEPEDQGDNPRRVANRLRDGRKDGRKGPKKVENIRSQREWGKPAERQEKGTPNMSSGDPLLRLLCVLAAYWRKRFTTCFPSLRKQGYKPLAQLEAEISSFKKDKHDPGQHGERIKDRSHFRRIAKTCEGSRDVGEQLFVALIRGLGIQARLVASLQPVGFGWGKNEAAALKTKKIGTETRVAEESESGASSDVVEVSRSSTLANQRRRSKGEVDRKGEEVAPMNISEDSGLESKEIAKERDDEDSVIEMAQSTFKKTQPNQNYDKDVSFPTYWAEVVSPITNEVYVVEPFLLNPPVANNPEHLALFEPKGAKADKAKLVFAYVVAYDDHGCAKEVTTRYLRRHKWPGRTKGNRIPVERIPVYNMKGKIERYEEYDWFKTVMSGYRQPHHMRTAVDDLEETIDLKPVKPEPHEMKEGEDTLQGYKSSAEYAMERHLRREEALRPGAIPVKYFTGGKGAKAEGEPIFLRKDVVLCRTGESWHKEGRQVRNGEHPVKMVPVRAVTLSRKREVEEAERDGGEKLKQGMYSKDQTEYIIPPPIEKGVIPKNAYGNMDCFVPSMVPKGAVHIPLRKTLTICKRLGIDYAEAVTGFEFGNKRAVPVIQGVVVATGNEKLVIDEWVKDEEERKRKEDGKRERVALASWRKFLMGLRIVERVRDRYSGNASDAHLKEQKNPFTNPNKIHKSRMGQQKENGSNAKTPNQADEDMAGGFVIDDVGGANVSGCGFPWDDDGELGEAATEGGGAFLPEYKRDSLAGNGELVIEHGDAVSWKAFETPGHKTEESSRAAQTADRVNDTLDVNSEEIVHIERQGRPKKTAIKTSKAKNGKKVVAKATPKTAKGLDTQ